MTFTQAIGLFDSPPPLDTDEQRLHLADIHCCNVSVVMRNGVLVECLVCHRSIRHQAPTNHTTWQVENYGPVTQFLECPRCKMWNPFTFAWKPTLGADKVSMYGIRPKCRVCGRRLP